jgi:hypothetical protein
MIRNILLVIPLALALAGCQTTDLTNLLPAVTAPIVNPITGVNIYQIKNVYAATLQLATDYRTYCYSKPYAAIMADPIAKPICQNRRAIIRNIQLAQAKASSAVKSADAFVQNNPTFTTSTALDAAWKAVTDFQSAVPKIN